MYTSLEFEILSFFIKMYLKILCLRANLAFLKQESKISSGSSFIEKEYSSQTLHQKKQIPKI